MTATIDLRAIRACDLMQTEVCWAEPGEDMAAAAGRMRDRGVRCLLVRGRPGELPGIVTTKDVVNLLIHLQPADLASVQVADVMTRPAICVPAGANMVDCIKLMRLSGVRRLPVLRDLDVVGVLSSSDVFERAMQL